ncbi:MAG: FeoA domain-containing protein [Candidatus Electryonea clarkiae]|nr:FeoA domain-containing protein [Candidatus Electryonea clarkiae]MDP8287011.1 FeoA domain-containing protein [Candidatus Electryonea clarkiae]
MRIGTLTESLEDYLEIIFRLLLTHKVARVRDIAKAKGVKTSSVTSALHRLAKEDLVEYEAREYVDLTDKGRELAFRISQRHEFLRRFFVEMLQVDPEIAEKDACSIEHAISVPTLDKLAAFCEFLTYCPDIDSNLISSFRDCWLQQEQDHTCDHKGECGIWRRKLALSKSKGIACLIDLKPGEGGYIARIIADEDERKELIRYGLLPSASLKVLDKKNDSIVLDASGQHIHLTNDQAESVFIWQYNIESEKKQEEKAIKIRTMADLEPGNSFRVIRLTAKGEIRQRLIDMGFIKGAEGKVIREALLRDPIEIEISGYYLSLRRSEASDVTIEFVND